ncbi:hypothetical protein NEMBOFW57_009432 [Staphylotrichum longicolle]|uniref:Uncharacterized protein n=1 Tax=Staphylotrichum longicolle TaxID=669026 RepID=A0AAD4EP18_9PEZI|nr:hypothetical protein NEMBOFW57_009432 [Staphylotrichum longicolle]
MWRGKGHLPPRVEIRQVASSAIDSALQTHSLERLIDIVRTPCRDAWLKAARRKHDKNAQLKREYYNMVMEMLTEALKKQEEEQLWKNPTDPTLGAAIESVTSN